MRFLVSSFVLAFTFAASALPFYQTVEKDIEGKELKLSSFKGKPVLVVNIASQCGYTPQLEDLEKLSAKYKAKGLVVLGVPSNEFGGQTPEDDQGMKEFCQKKYSVKFPLLNKGMVNGPSPRPLYKFLKTEAGKDFEGDIKWNFEKFLVGPDGKVVKRWASDTKPMDLALTGEIEKLLK